ncbi:hypothetical protein NVP1188A_52 [Vibrio phage 1.188.A._10N.286.51.A6]|uniref:Uncharacterized protein n=5 Tax=Mukerjeevirus TaxID=2733146 RepID=A0A2I7REL0_9CAUD|nr:hypothetical protein HOU76_gp32 [Vibrio phage 1.169.O._10N.261.52.B1]YP_009817511.1 hypothetical protein HOU77_gp54 [Vibrio phage 1.188.A._10N.286.51.A6]YP_009817734.1 hypothetical protein HOU80_gp53 [Vibrio phage 1.261.O._10N.286.51.A7]AUR93706.1 hypothetical protein NVP1188B_52 [Vibrio phage 1.188.B._10N.286.51.A6]AUR93792.1 hypothetical protein NVP1188C_52 [Vibrio phage 1.188.C._10N.286.51.A6]AUR92095.1 hypothetical protein NVP1169O_67 [Vibrio phage 1.169.O._10N.261.52.B1]AUR93620.1 hyp
MYPDIKFGNVDPNATDKAKVDSTDWIRSLFGDSETAGIAQGVTDVASGVINSWLGYKQLGVAEDQVALQKEAFNQNKATSNMEAALKLDAMQRGLAHHGVQSSAVDKYATEYAQK